MDGTDLQPVAAARTPLNEGVSALEALQTIARDCIGQIKGCQRGLHARSPEALHQARVALRRWRTALAVFGEILTEEGRSLQGELDWLAGELNEARDLDVFAPCLELRRRAPDADPAGLAALGAALNEAQARAYERAEQALRSERARRAFWEGVRPAQASAQTGDGEPPMARKLVARALDRRRRQLTRGGRRLGKLDAEARHTLRIRAKKARYAAELFGELFGHKRRQRRFTLALKDLQDSLGELNDIHVGGSLAQGLARQAGLAEAGFEAGLIVGARACREAMLTERAGKAYARLAAVDRFW